MNKNEDNVREIADMFEADTYTIGTTGQEALIVMMENAHRTFTHPDIDRDWLTNSDGTVANIVDVLDAIALCAHRLQDEGLLDIRPEEIGNPIIELIR
jgi:hypothetical protein